MTIQEIKASTKVYLDVEDICPSIVPISARCFRKKVREGNTDFGFPISQVGKQILIPRKPFLFFLEGHNRQY